MPRLWPADGRQAVQIGGDDEAFFRRAAKTLDKLNRTDAGSELLTRLANRRAGAPALYVTIFSKEYNRCVEVPRGGDPGLKEGRTLLAQALLGDTAAVNIPDEIQACLDAMGHPGRAGHAWLATTVNNSPIYDIRGMPSTNQSRIGLTEANVSDWIRKASIYPAPFPPDQQNNLTLLILTALWEGSRTRPGGGSHSRVEWNPTRRQITLTTGQVLTGSKSVSLGHELTHALYNGEGLQLGRDHGHFSTVLYEYMCVGLGPWATEPCSENKYRAQWTGTTLARRPCY